MQFTEKIVLFFVSGLIILFPISLIRILFPMQSDMMLRKKRWCKFLALPVLRYTIGSQATRFTIQNKTEEPKMVPSHFFHLFSLALINSFTVYCQIDGKGSLLDFQIQICRCLLKADKEVDSDQDMENLPRLKGSFNQGQANP